jgi:hypothetical protein
MTNKKVYTVLTILLTLFLLYTKIDTAEGKPVFSFSILGGPQYGGVIEDRSVDAVTSASKFGGKTGIRAEFTFRDNFVIETGLEHLFFKQELKYNDINNNYNGKRKLAIQQLRIPLTYNLHLHENKHHDPLIILRFGLYLGLLLSDNTEDFGAVPGYTVKHIDGGVVIAGLINPFTIGKHITTGIYLDFQRGATTFYDDPYQKGNWIGGRRTSALGIGLQLRFCNF